MPKDHGVYEDMEKLYDSIMEKIQILADGDVLTSYEASTLFDAFKAVFEKLGDTNKTQKEVKTIMGEKILTFSADKIYKEGMEKGEEKELWFKIYMYIFFLSLQTGISRFNLCS